MNLWNFFENILFSTKVNQLFHKHMLKLLSNITIDAISKERK